MFSPFTVATWDVEDFSGGMTDNYLGGKINQFHLADNFVLTDNKKLLTRGGSQISDPLHYLPGYVGFQQRTNLLFVFESVLWEQQVRDLYYNLNNVGYVTIHGPTGNKPFPAGTAANRTAWGYWNHHQILVSDALCTPQKLYKDNAGVFQIRTAGLPPLATRPTALGANTLMYAFANDLKAKYNAHLASGAQHTTAVDALNVLTSPDATSFASLVLLISEAMVKFTIGHEADSQLNAAWAYHRAKATVPRPLASLVPPVTLTECAIRLTDLAAKFNSHTSDSTTHAVGGLHLSVLAAPTVHTYIYAFCYTYTYMVGTVTFKDYGPTTIVVVPTVDIPPVSAINIANLPVLANGPTENYDTAVITIEIYRTIDSGQTLYYVGSVVNGTTVFVDTSSDTTLQAVNRIIYTDGGVLDNDPPPKAKFVTVANDIAWYGHVQEGAEIHTNRIRQSIPSDFDSCPESFFIDMEDAITGIGNVGIYPIVFCTQRIYRLEGFYDLTGRGVLQKVEISRVTGCTSHLGIVVTLEGLFFPGNDGFYWTDGYSVVKISAEINTTYAALINKQNMYGAYDATNKRIYWGIQQSVSSGDNDAIAIADLKFGSQVDGTPFTTASGLAGFAPTALAFYNSALYRGDKRGYLFQHLDSLQTDLKMNTATAPSTWLQQTIIYNYVSVATNFGSIFTRKWVPKLVLYAKSISSVSIGLNSYNDDSSISKALKEIRIITSVTWGDSGQGWGSPSCLWNYSALIKAERNFPAGGLRCDYKQVQITNSFTVIINSDELGMGTVNAATKVITLQTSPPNIWPDLAIDYSISFEADGYVKNYLITDRTDSTLTYSDAGNTTITGPNTKWIIRGYRKNDVLSLLNYTLMYVLMSDTQPKFNPLDTGGNA